MDAIQAKSRSTSPTAGASSATAPTQQNQAGSGRNSPEAQVANQITDSSTLTTSTVPAAGQDQKPTYANIVSGRSSSSSSDRSRTPSPENKSPSKFEQFVNKVGNKISNAFNGNTNKTTAQTTAQIQQPAELSTSSTTDASIEQEAPQSPPATSETGASDASSFVTAASEKQGSSAASSRDDTTVVETHNNAGSAQPTHSENTNQDPAATTSTTTSLNDTITTTSTEAQNMSVTASPAKQIPVAPNAAELEAEQTRLTQEQTTLEATSEQTQGDADENKQPSAPNAAEVETQRLAQEQAAREAAQRLAKQALREATSEQTHEGADENKQPSAPNAETTGPKTPIQTPQTLPAPKKTVSCFKKHMKLIIISSIALIVAGLIAAPFIYDSQKTLAVLNNGLEATNSLIGKTGFSTFALGGIALGVILVIALIALIAFYIKGKNTMKEANETLPAAPTSFEIPELAKEMNMTINFNPNDLATTKAFEDKKADLQKLIDKDRRNDDQIPIWTLVINMGNIASTDQNAHAIAQKLVDNINLCDGYYCCTICCQFNDRAFFVNKSNKKLENLDTNFKSISDFAKNDINTRIINITLSENKEQQQEIKPNIKTDTMAVKAYHGVNKVLNLATCNKFKLETEVTV